ncbi:survival motor neuron protein-like isoform X1 [Portunus trituberculatus]|uniref:survival motor neuron protein-like isoform X1 n=1 Tax=Portunus trituberculatus TaxID=210409 RepID=UPI001E1D0805|nr:survival motor neuron protein-like isoform X1 [Portunus trituberculatus]XP_045115070.1 survival motor neuron protein-like isoform X1 [Portunus trituberculatus]XP_045115071.1 survival motor neuron protein-like isoform X1 [Portunus trituberculatus]
MLHSSPTATVEQPVTPRPRKRHLLKKRLVQDAKQDELTHEEIWDDTLLIQQYDEAMAKVTSKLAQRTSMANTTESEQSEASHRDMGGQDQQHANYNTTSNSNRKKKKKSKKKHDWQIGNYCRACYTEDNEWYEATIIAINPHTGRCTVRYLGYNNEEQLPLNVLHKTKGEAARRKQLEMAACDAMSEMDQCSSVAESDQQSDTDCEKNSKRQCLPSNQYNPHNMMPPPNYPSGGLSTPPPHLPLLPPPPALALNTGENSETSEALHTMLMSWYMTGYHTGYYQGIQQTQARRKNR